MTSHRSSWWKTISLASAATVGELAFVSWMSSAILRHGSSWPVLVAAASLIVVLTAAVTSAWALLIVIGGFIALRRDTLEERGISYASTRPRERLSGPTGRRIRSVFRRVRDAIAPSAKLDLRAGELVQVRSLAEILATLDESGTVHGLIFMPEMAALCGQSFTVFRRVDKLNDWVGHTGLRRVHQTVLLNDVRCDGSGHDGCQNSCAVRWHESWLRRVEAPDRGPQPDAARDSPRSKVSEPQLYQLARRCADDGTTRYVCQATELSAGSTPVLWGDPRHYLRDLVRGNIRFVPLLTGAAIYAFNRAQRFRRGAGFPYIALPDATTTPHASLDLRPGEIVRVRPKHEIEKTLSSKALNRGLSFDIEMVRHCGREYRVASRVERLIDERRGTMKVITNPCIILDGVAASAEYNGFCAQNEAIFWREIWLERASGSPGMRAEGTG